MHSFGWINMKHFNLIVEEMLLSCCQTLGLVLRVRVDFVLPLSQEEEEQEEQEPPTKIYQMAVY